MAPLALPSTKELWTPTAQSREQMDYLGGRHLLSVTRIHSLKMVEMLLLITLLVLFVSPSVLLISPY